MKRWKHEPYGMDLKPGGEWIRYDDHVEAMKRIAGGGVDAAAFIERKADDYAREFGTNDMGSLSFGNEDMRIYHWHLVELADEIRGLAAPSASAQQAEPVGYVSRRDVERLHTYKGTIWPTTTEIDAVPVYLASPAPVAPWPDFHGQPIRHGDRLRHEDGTEFTAVHLHGHDYEGDAWRAVYDDATVSRLGLQIGDKGRAVLAGEKGNG